MVKQNTEINQYQLRMGKTLVLKTTTIEAQRLADIAQKMREKALQETYEKANQLSQDEVKMDLWQKLEMGGQELMGEHANLLRLAKMRLAGRLRLGRNGWMELAENPEQSE